MIFVTVGTTHFDGLVRAVDEVFLASKPKEDVVFQIGSGHYQPSSGKFFRFKPSIESEIENASLVITHGGMTVLGLLAQRKRFMAVANAALADNHQVAMLKQISRYSSFVWTDNLHEVRACIEKAISSPVATWNAPSLSDDLNSYIRARARR